MVAADDRLDALANRFYDAAMGICGWDAVLHDLTRAFRAELAAFGIVGPHAPGRILHTGIDPALVERYLLCHAGRNELALRTEHLPAGTVVTDTGLMPKAEFRQTDFYRDCLRPLGLDSLMNLRAARHANGLAANLCLFRTPRQGDFGAEDIAAYAGLAPHLCRAVALHLRVAEADGDRRALVSALETLPHAALLVDGAANVLRTNAAGAALLAARDGLQSDRARGGALRARHAEETAALRRMVAAAVDAPGLGADGAEPLCLSRPPPSRPPLIVAVLSLGAAGASSLGLPPAAAALLLVTDPAHRPDPPSRTVLREAFGLTRAEAEVAARAGQGEEVARIAEALGITQGTTRLHLHRVFGKTGVHRQAELALVLSGLRR
ncbi:LuxR C-terminal-related transcriptional regulator [Dankookia sp. GCM10030260]|uniref:helix-turn-helix transcriptional regulator n=1 Tax=Dankookia sp. GCM10030260 TaxID=3273390 RepID=UPI003610B226